MIARKPLNGCAIISLMIIIFPEAFFRLFLIAEGCRGEAFVSCRVKQLNPGSWFRNYLTNVSKIFKFAWLQDWIAIPF
jgi:hypothetical protein